MSKESEHAMLEDLIQQAVPIVFEADQYYSELCKYDLLTTKQGTCLDHGVPAAKCGTHGDSDDW